MIHPIFELEIVYKIISQKEDLKHDVAENKMKDHKRKRTGKADDVEKALYTWFVDARARDVPITILESGGERPSN